MILAGGSLLKATEIRQVRSFGLGSLASVEVSPNRKLVALAGSEGIQMLDAVTGAHVRGLSAPEQGGIQLIDFSPDGAKLTAGTALGWVQCWDLSSGALVNSVNLRNARVVQRQLEQGPIVRHFLNFGIADVGFLSNSRNLVAGDGLSGSVPVWDSKEN